jgi:hypothetical protein
VPPPSRPALFTFWPPATNNPSLAGELSMKPPSPDEFWQRQNIGWYVAPASSTPGVVLKLRLHAPAPLSVSPLHQRTLVLRLRLCLVLRRRLCLVLCLWCPFYMGDPSTPSIVLPARTLDFNDAFNCYSVCILRSRQGSMCS